MISLLLPTRGRPDSLRRLVNSVLETADNPNEVELVVFVDRDDESYDRQNYPDNVRLLYAKRTTLSVYWNMAYERAQGPIYMHCGDDLVFKTEGWDTKVKQAFEKYPDKIVFVYGDDGDPAKKHFGTHGFLHHKWAEAVGYFVPPYFSSDFNDTWLNEVADMVGRKEKIDIITEHMHPAFGKGELDLTHAERLVRHWRDKMPELYASKGDERKQDAEKLRKVMS